MAKRARRKNKNIVAAVCAFLLLVAGIVLLYLEKADGAGFPAKVDADFAATPAADSGLRVSFVDVGQGDCIIITCGGRSMLIDAGDNGTEQTVINYVRQQGISRFDYVVATHPHTDHIGGMPEVLNIFDTSNIIMPAVPQAITPTSSTYSAFLSAVADEKSSGAKVISAKAGSRYTLGDAEFVIVAPIDYNADDLNNISVVIRLDYGENSFLFTGDASSYEEKAILSSGADVDCDILKVGHHGSSSSSGAKFLKAVTPQVAVIMCGRDNSYNHPNAKTVDRLNKHTDRVYRTDICSTVVINCDKSGYRITY